MEAVCELTLKKQVSTAKREQSIKSKSKEIACLGAEGPAVCGGWPGSTTGLGTMGGRKGARGVLGDSGWGEHEQMDVSSLGVGVGEGAVCSEPPESLLGGTLRYTHRSLWKQQVSKGKFTVYYQARAFAIRLENPPVDLPLQNLPQSCQK